MGIFAKPNTTQNENKYGIKVLFLHGLESNGTGTKATALSEEWGALCPALRTHDLRLLRNACNGMWHTLKQSEIDDVFQTPYEDARAAVRYSQPDVIIGSSMSGAILFKLIAEEEFSGPAVFCAPAIGGLLPRAYVENIVNKKSERYKDTVWLLGELDTIVSNSHNKKIAKSIGASIIISPNDTHRLNKAVEANILNAAVLTAIEMAES